MRQLADAALKVQEDIWYEKEYREPKQFSVVEPSLAYKVPDSQKINFNQPIRKQSFTQSTSDLQRSSFDPFRHYHSQSYQQSSFRNNNNNNSATVTPGIRNNSIFEQRRSSDQGQEQSRQNFNTPRNVSWANPLNDPGHVSPAPTQRRSSESESSPRINSSFTANRSSSLENATTSSQRNNVCFTCGSEGHFSRNCPRRQNQNSGNEPNLNRM